MSADYNIRMEIDKPAANDLRMVRRVCQPPVAKSPSIAPES